MPTVACWDERQFDFDVHSTALLVIDMQQDFFADAPALEAAKPGVTAVVAAARLAGMTIIHTREGYTAADGPDVNAYKKHLGYVGRESPSGPFLIRGTEGHDFAPDFEPADGEAVVDKAGFSGFYGTDLQEMLAGITHLVIVGITTQCCVHSTLRDAVERAYFCLTVYDATAAEEVDVHNATMKIIQAERHLFGWISDAASTANAISGADA